MATTTKLAPDDPTMQVYIIEVTEESVYKNCIR